MSRARRALVAVFGLLPGSAVKNVILRRLGLQIGRGSSIGPSLILGIGEFVMEENSTIGTGNVIRDLSSFRIRANGRLGQWNWISASRDLIAAGNPGMFEIGCHSAVTSRHYIDASGGVVIGNFTTVAGVRSTLITHGIDWRTGTQRTRSIKIGDYCLISSNNSITPGTTISDHVITGMGSTLAGKLDVEFGLYHDQRGSLSRTDLSGSYFVRDVGYIFPAQVAGPEAIKDESV